MADALLERTILWPLDGNVIPTSLCISSVDSKTFFSIEQFAIIASFIENTEIYFDDEANKQMITWCDDLKEKSNFSLRTNRVNDAFTDSYPFDWNF